ncbi:hypothetical protein L3X38_005851 [Prunus dulcis]|uniref:Uncharacterized protein n=1 Tax=Prunus dulcis TaxID=3755 RepID=A0AAD4ZRN9_PRUDU|nr:hypothetical protein L3X38_005851 [Prunus dulcis]
MNNRASLANNLPLFFASAFSIDTEGPCLFPSQSQLVQHWPISVSVSRTRELTSCSDQEDDPYSCVRCSLHHNKLLILWNLEKKTKSKKTGSRDGRQRKMHLPSLHLRFPRTQYIPLLSQTLEQDLPTLLSMHLHCKRGCHLRIQVFQSHGQSNFRLFEASGLFPWWWWSGGGGERDGGESGGGDDDGVGGCGSGCGGGGGGGSGGCWLWRL